jgi:hypothetical protein
VAALALHSFALFCVATAVIGIYNAVGLQYRFAAAEVASRTDKARAISLVLAGGIVGGFVGPAITRWGRDWFSAPFMGSFVLLAATAIVALAVQSLVHVPTVFIVAALAGALGYGLMGLLMNATPLAMDFCGLPYAAAATVISWHVVGMYGPGFVTGTLIGRYGVLNVILAGVVVMAVGAAVALTGNEVTHFLAALVLVGVGWNFMYTGGTTLLTESYTPAEKARTQGANDFCVFAVLAISSFASGALVSGPGWEVINVAAIGSLALIGAAVVWYARMRAKVAAKPA